MNAALLPNIMSKCRGPLIMLALMPLYGLMWPHYEYADRCAAHMSKPLHVSTLTFIKEGSYGKSSWDWRD